MTDLVVLIMATLFAYRLWRLWAEDPFPPVAWVRDRFDAWVLRRFGGDWQTGVLCAWCSGAWVSFATVGAVWYFRPLPLPALWFGAVAALVGLLAQVDEG